MDEIPWSRLMTYFGRATRTPAMIAGLSSADGIVREEARSWLGKHLEYPDGVIQATPPAVFFMLRTLQNRTAKDWGAVCNLLQKFFASAQFTISHERLEDLAPLSAEEAIKDGISEKYLWPEYVNELTDEKLLEAVPEWWRRQWISWHWQTAELIRNSLDLFRVRTAGKSRNRSARPNRRSGECWSTENAGPTVNIK